MNKSRLLNTTAIIQPTSPAQISKNYASDSSTYISPIEKTFSFTIGRSGRGVIVSNPMTIDGGGVNIASSQIDPVELRRSLLFWDAIVWPDTNGISIGDGPDEEFLIREGRLFRPIFRVNGDGARALSMAFADTFSILEDKQPGHWMMSNAIKGLTTAREGLTNDRGMVVDLVNAIPIPMHDMPLEDVLRFKEKRMSEVLALRSALDNFYQNWVNSEDQHHQFQMSLNSVETASSEMIKVAKESGNPFTMSSWKLNYSLGVPDLLSGALKAYAASAYFDFSGVSALLIGATSGLSITKDIGLKSAKTSSPFGYVASIHKDLM